MTGNTLGFVFPQCPLWLSHLTQQVRSMAEPVSAALYG